MSRIVRGDGGPKRADVSLYVLPDRPGIKRTRTCMQRARARPGIQSARPGIQHARPGIQHARPGIRIQRA